jgi:hypothetical protein
VDDLRDHADPARAGGKLLKPAGGHLPLELATSRDEVDVGLDASGLQARQGAHGDGLRDAGSVAFVNLRVRDCDLAQCQGETAGGLCDALGWDYLSEELSRKMAYVISELSGGELACHGVSFGGLPVAM